jgi:hypothetical protein
MNSSSSSRVAALDHSHGHRPWFLSGTKNSRVAAKESFAATRLIETQTTTTAFSRGYILSPLRG